MIKLKPCPICKKEVKWCKDISDNHLAGEFCHHIVCEECFSFDVLSLVDNEVWNESEYEIYKAITLKWNTRND